MIRTGRLINQIAPTHQLLLIATLAETDRAQQAWASWCGAVVFDDVDGPELRLLPALARRPDVVDAEDRLHGRIRGLFRKSWVSNERLISSSVPARSRLVEEGIPILHVEALPLAEVTSDRGTRPLYDIDFCVPRRSMGSTLRVLTDLGWQETNRGVRARIQHRPRHLRNGESRLRLIDRAPWPGADLCAWETPSVTEFGERLLTTEDALVHAAVRSTQPWQRPAAYWVADVVRLSASLGNRRTIEALRDDLVIDRAVAHGAHEVVQSALSAADRLIGPIAT